MKICGRALIQARGCARSQSFLICNKAGFCVWVRVSTGIIVLRLRSPRRQSCGRHDVAQHKRRCASSCAQLTGHIQRAAWLDHNQMTTMRRKDNVCWRLNSDIGVSMVIR